MPGINGLWKSLDGKILINITETIDSVWYWDAQFQLLKKDSVVTYPPTGKIFKGVIPRREGQAIRINAQFLATRTVDSKSRYIAKVYPVILPDGIEFFNHQLGEPWNGSI